MCSSDLGQEKDLQVVLVDVARQALQSQGATPNASLPLGVEDPNTLRAELATRTTTGSATQDVTIGFDLVNGNSSTVHCGDAITLANTKLYDFGNTGAPPVPLV